MKRLFIFLLGTFFIFQFCFSQIPLTVAASGGNKKASVSERIGLTDITIRYDRPAVKGREGKIWGQLVHVGFIDQNFGSSKAAPWRAGANENTAISFSTPVTVNGHELPAGSYGFFMAYDANEPTLIFSRNSTSWGSYFYDPKEDALRIKVKPVPLDKSVEWLKYEFMNETDTSTTIALQWEKLMFPFRVDVNYKRDQVESFRRELRTEKGFLWQSWNQAAQWCLLNNYNLEQGLQWSDSATGRFFGGDKDFGAWTVRAQLFEKLGRSDEAATVMKKALPLGQMMDLHQYGRQLLAQKKTKEALEVFKMNYANNPKEFTAIVGLTRGYSAIGDYKSALKYANEALPLAPNDQNKTNVQTMIGKLKEGKDVN